MRSETQLSSGRRQSLEARQVFSAGAVSARKPGASTLTEGVWEPGHRAQGPVSLGGGSQQLTEPAAGADPRSEKQSNSLWPRKSSGSSRTRCNPSSSSSDVSASSSMSSVSMQPRAGGGGGGGNEAAAPGAGCRGEGPPAAAGGAGMRPGDGVAADCRCVLPAPGDCETGKGWKETGDPKEPYARVPGGGGGPSGAPRGRRPLSMPGPAYGCRVRGACGPWVCGGTCSRQ
jgi:hypothetical protein